MTASHLRVSAKSAASALAAVHGDEAARGRKT